MQASKGGRLLAVRPTLSDFVLKMKRGAQVVYPKDIGLILVYADIYPGATVLEAGTGSASLTLALARAVGESGRRDLLRVARGSPRAGGCQRAMRGTRASGSCHTNLELRVGDVFEGVPEDETSIGWSSTCPSRGAPSGTTTAVSGRRGDHVLLPADDPPGSADRRGACARGGFGMIETFEGLVRTWNVEGQSVRPDHRMVAHTGFSDHGAETRPLKSTPCRMLTAVFPLKG